MLAAPASEESLPEPALDPLPEAITEKPACSQPIPEPETEATDLIETSQPEPALEELSTLITEPVHLEKSVSELDNDDSQLPLSANDAPEAVPLLARPELEAKEGSVAIAEAASENRQGGGTSEVSTSVCDEFQQQASPEREVPASIDVLPSDTAVDPRQEAIDELPQSD